MPIVDTSGKEILIVYEIVSTESRISSTPDDVGSIIRDAVETEDFNMALQTLSTHPIFRYARIFKNVTITDLSPEPILEDDFSPDTKTKDDTPVIIGASVAGVLVLSAIVYYALRKAGKIGEPTLFLNSVVPMSDEEVAMMGDNDDDDEVDNSDNDSHQEGDSD